jgi:hypothetical protein
MYVVNHLLRSYTIRSQKSTAVTFKLTHYPVSPGVSWISRKAFHGTQCLAHRVLPIGRELVPVRLGVGEHDLARKCGDLRRIANRPILNRHGFGRALP